MPDLETNLPSVRNIQNFIQEKNEVELKLVTDDLIVGQILWQDTYCLCIVDHYQQTTIVWRQSIVFMKPKA